jgi:peptide chain release factor subunit 1
VQSALSSLRVKLSNVKVLPPNGLALFCGCIGKDGKDKRLFVFEPLKPLVSGMYRCDSKFHLEPLYEQLEASRTYGFIIIDGNGVSIHTLSGNIRRTLFKLEVNLPNKHGPVGNLKIGLLIFERKKEVGILLKWLRSLLRNLLIRPLVCLLWMVSF